MNKDKKTYYQRNNRKMNKAKIAVHKKNYREINKDKIADHNNIKNLTKTKKHSIREIIEK